MYTFSQTVFVDNKNLLHNNRGMLVQFPVNDMEVLNNSDGMPQLATVHSLALDGSQHALSELAWRYIVAIPYKGRTVQDLFVAPHSLEAITSVYDQQGALRSKTIESDASTAAERIQAIVESPIFRQRTKEVATMRLVAEDSFEQFLADLITRGVDLRRMKALIDKRAATVKRRGFVACSPIVRS